MIPWFQYQSIDIGFLKLNVWGMLVSLGFLSGMAVSYFECKRKKLEAKRIYDLTFWIILCSMIGGRLLYAAEHFPQYLNAPLDILKMWQGGMSVYGGFIGAVVAVIIYLRKNKLDFWKYADILAFVLPLGLFIGRIGCFFIHDHPGVKTDFFLGVAYPGGMRHDLGLYLSLNGLILFLIFLFLCRRERFPGFYVAVLAGWYGAIRFFLDFLRAYDVVLGMAPDPRYFGLTLAQYVSLGLLLAGLFIFYKFGRRPQKNNSV